MNQTNQVMVFDSTARTFSSKIHQIPELSPGQVAIEVACCTICGSDLHTYQGRRTGPEQCVLGHEIVGRVAGWGGDHPPRDYFDNPIAIDQRITWAMAVGCQSCFYCRHELPQKCERLFKYGHAFDPGDGSTGGLGKYCYLVPGTPLFPVPESIDDTVAAPANCATATVCAAIRLVLETHPIDGSSVLVVGLGMLGLNAVAQLAEAGAASIIVMDRDQKRVDLSKRFGATHTIDAASTQEELQEQVRTMTNGRGADVALDFAGVAAAVETAIGCVRTGGCVLLAGSVFPTGEIPLNPESIVRRMITLRGLHNYAPRDLKEALGFLERTHQRFPFAELVSRSFALDEVSEAFEFAATNRPIRVAIV